MPSYISNDGEVTPRLEKVALKRINKETGQEEPYIYEGPDRAATEYLKSQGVDHLGRDFRKDPDIIMRAHEQKKTVNQFCELHEHTDKKRAEEFKRKSEIPVTHTLPRRVQAQEKMGGGVNTADRSGKTHRKGGWDLPADAEQAKNA